jgi:RNA polymerase sigma-70 factor (ECF subfamily)
MVPNEETEMIGRARSGDHGAYEYLYRHHAATVRSWCWHITRNCADADDLAQEVFMRLFLNLPSFRCESKLRTWLYRVVVNCALMQLRRQKRTIPSLNSIVSRDAPLLNDESTLENTIPPSARERVIIMQALDALPPAKRSVFIMHDVSGFTHREIARHLSLSIESSKCRLRRARMELRSVLSA